MKWRLVSKEIPLRSTSERSKAVLIWCSTSKCIYSAVYNFSTNGWESFGGHGEFYGEITHWHPMPKRPNIQTNAKAIMDEMTDDERLSLMREYCVHCGTKHTPCYCTRND